MYLHGCRFYKIAHLPSIQYLEASLTLAIAVQLFHQPSEEAPHLFHAYIFRDVDHLTPNASFPTSTPLLRSAFISSMS